MIFGDATIQQIGNDRSITTPVRVMHDHQAVRGMAVISDKTECSSEGIIGDVIQFLPTGKVGNNDARAGIASRVRSYGCDLSPPVSPVAVAHLDRRELGRSRYDWRFHRRDQRSVVLDESENFTPIGMRSVEAELQDGRIGVPRQFAEEHARQRLIAGFKRNNRRPRNDFDIVGRTSKPLTRNLQRLGNLAECVQPNHDIATKRDVFRPHGSVCHAFAIPLRHEVRRGRVQLVPFVR
ncbi:hypothetical protein G6K93_31010 [Agrobacterium rhizogenes]|uniref:hypothetical protein n=1 Tax=Rhizobium rhizogenes TaxID=359 RepID=UPI00115F6D00|nr:hypothetical protein [Rhizobium rhizogenes]NTF52738.1 hypothetical protein [Rhizobium rhizogenes]NTG18255.1 hypothetical protein [Rhizobium rhizogenes]NTG25087.1 hypothetical protein [Rhizobium rhizogenes]NTG31973.1 hypothetical protein [Rhizobium rhizogenes]NTG38858.1 hypothetical protein [Rhizobium rhizogenes]